MSRRFQAGTTLMETLMAMAIVGVMIFTSLAVTSSAIQQSRLNSDKQFATQKAITMLEELRGLVQVSNGLTITVLDNYDDGVSYNPVLTSNKKIIDPAAPISGNTSTGPATWAFMRRISVQRLPGQANNIRLVNVKVFKNEPTGIRLLAEVASVIRTLVVSLPPSQVFDVYNIAVENVPGWWVYMSNIVPFVNNAINDLESRNPGLVFRVHRIVSLSYGRDQQYKPYINETNDSTADINSVYFYPATMPTGSANNYYYYSRFFKGHVNIDGADTNGLDTVASSPTYNPYPYAVADMYNNSMRYQDELNLYNNRKAANPNEEMTLRLLLDDMVMHPSNYTNTILINLHGELMPFPPIRNYSDAAKDPVKWPGVRVVTHPQNIHYQNTDAVKLRVYSYLTNPGAATTTLTDPIAVTICCTNNWTPTTANPVRSIDNTYGWVTTPSVAGAGMYWTTPGPTPFGTLFSTTFYLYNSPLKVGYNTGTGKGLHPSLWLYGMEYIPSPQEDLTGVAIGSEFTEGTLDLSTADSPVTEPKPKNTARWTITLPASIFNNNSMLTISTHIISDPSLGLLQPFPNGSNTYVWRGTDAWALGSSTTDPAMPITERFQFLGDPRHCPYADLKRPHVSGTYAGAESPLGEGYSRFFDDLEDAPTGNVMQSAYEIGTNTGPYNITSSNRVFSFQVNGSGVTTNCNLTTGVSVPVSQLVTDLNSTCVGFSALATASNANNRLLVTSNQVGGSTAFKFITATSNNASAVLGFDGNSHTAPMWKGWYYNGPAGGPYGVKNNGTDNDDGWYAGGTTIEYDVPRAFQIIRSALTLSQAIYTTMTGFSYYYMGIGNEIGYDSANNFPNSIPVSSKPYTGVSGTVFDNTITGGCGASPPSPCEPGAVKYIKENLSSNYWWSPSWLGELYPDSMYASDWQPNGNLPTGTGAGKFIRVPREQIGTSANPTTTFPLPPGTTFNQAVRRTSAQGSTTLFWVGSSGSTFHHIYADGTTGTIQTEGNEIATGYQFPVPASIANARPFGLTENNTGMNPDFFLQAGYGGTYSSGVLDQYYQHDVDLKQGSSLVWLKEPVNSKPAFIVVNGLSPTGISGAAFIARWAFLSLVHTYFEAGLYTDASTSPTNKWHVRQLPQVVITAPDIYTNLNNPMSISINWSTNWVRWDGRPYTPSYPSPYTTDSSITLKYAVLISRDNGITWFYAQDMLLPSPTPAKIGVKPDAAHELTSAPYTLDTSNTTIYPEGSYVIRVEAYREGYPQHYSFHQFRGYVNR